MRPDCAVIATMHGKETVIAPLLQGALGLRTELPTDFDTDCFGTFSGDVPRVDTALATARAKIAAAFKQVPHAHIGIASEGSFGPHPLLPMIPIDSELLLLMDRRTGIEVVGHHATPRTNYAHCVVTAAEAAVAFAQRTGFPAHGLMRDRHAGWQACSRTHVIRATASVCTGCGYRDEQITEASSADPDGCDHCNP